MQLLGGLPGAAAAAKNDTNVSGGGLLRAVILSGGPMPGADLEEVTIMNRKTGFGAVAVGAAVIALSAMSAARAGQGEQQPGDHHGRAAGARGAGPAGRL